MTQLLPTKVDVLGMPLERWKYESCIAEFGVGDDWATLYSIASSEPGKGHATYLLLEAKKYYEALGKKVGGDVALNERMRGLYKKVGYPEYA